MVGRKGNAKKKNSTLRLANDANTGAIDPFPLTDSQQKASRDTIFYDGVMCSTSARAPSASPSTRR